MKLKIILLAIILGFLGVCLQPLVMPYYGQMFLNLGL